MAQAATDSVLLTKDLYSSKWIRTLSEKKCPKTLLITVISAPDHVAEREAIRKGWGDTATKMAKVALSTVHVLLSRFYLVKIRMKSG